MTGVIGVGVALPGVTDLADIGGGTFDRSAKVDPAARIGRKGLRYKDRATQLGLVAAHDALVDAGLWVDGALTVPGESVAVLASSNLGNLDTVCEVSATIAAEGVVSTSPMALPNASSNVVASTTAIRFGLKGANLMVCNGATSGLDAVHWAATMLNAGRAEYAVVIGVEVANEVTERFTGSTDLLDGAAAIVLQAGAHGVPLGRFTRSGALSDVVSGTDGAWFVPEGFTGEAPIPGLANATRHDLAESFGRCGGALGVLQCAAATVLLRAGATEPVVVSNDGHEAAAGLALLPTGGSAQPEGNGR
ncbi:beta-ketoacyl synthase N-terminal-like domain-containing protein [Actinokineospora inagensis]|uniref:beta-ketoacyl synthase N-terminal-like domain-containing protein n=1 Tax=Actinokineospora inagensis TaxID=103730 RepID=UPI00040B924E|nr:beta-ketoacyl synthase N-terminal-like domain-containing protein [Actinokineospora inagensis]